MCTNALAGNQFLFTGAHPFFCFKSDSWQNLILGSEHLHYSQENKQFGSPTGPD